ncbi:MAG: putative transport system permease protein [Solirubrobacteraceae bacterium]|nr:putative transport system permease protein [Solirubrobacteraceae bacterium]
MRKVALKGLLARKLRVALTALAISLGVMLIAGTYVFTDTINKSFDAIFTAVYAKTDAVVSPNDDIGSQDTGTLPSLDGSVLARVKGLPEVGQAEGVVNDQSGVVIGKDGKPIKSGGAPTLIGSVLPERFSAISYPQGRAPATADEVAIDQATADRKHLKLGDTIGLQAAAPRKQYRIVGLVKIAGVSSLGGATSAELILPEAQRVTGKVGRYDELYVAGSPGTSPEQLRAAIRRVEPASVTVRTGKQETKSQQDDIKGALSFLTTALLAFAGISLFVGAFIIFNTFSITVAQRAREFALLRTLGASRRQVLRSVLTEGLVLGVLGSVIGLGVGILVASGLRALFKAVGVDLPSSGTVIASRTIIVSLLVGIIVTLVASLAPALRATRVPPVAALREGVALPQTRSSRLAFPLAIVLTALGFGLMALGLFGSGSSSSALSLLGGGAALTFIGVALLSPRLVGPIASAVGLPLQRVAGMTGRLARENTVRQPGRTAVTAAALMIGVALVTFASIFAAGAKKTINDAVDTGSNASVILQNVNGFGPFSQGAAREVAAVDGVRDVSPMRFSQGRLDGKDIAITGIDPASFSKLYNVTKGGDALSALRPGGVVVGKTYAKDHDIKVGQTLQVQSPTTRTVPLRVTGIAEDRGQLLSPLTIANASATRDFSSDKDGFALVGFAPGTDAKAVKRAVDARLSADFPQVEALTESEFKGNQADQINQLLGLIYALLALAIVVSLFGIVNTLVLSITERTRELGMLRAIGTSRRQVRRMIRYEAVITALIGGVLGLVLGVVLAILVTQPLDGFKLSIPAGSLFLVLVLSAVAGVLAAVLPARRASRLDVLDALAYE